MVSYDDATSFGTSRTQLIVGHTLSCNYKIAEKGKFIRDKNLAGFAMWELGGDYKNILVNSIRSAMKMTP
jgi:GH18 family chitinase